MKSYIEICFNEANCEYKIKLWITKAYQFIWSLVDHFYCIFILKPISILCICFCVCFQRVKKCVCFSSILFHFFKKLMEKIEKISQSWIFLHNNIFLQLCKYHLIYFNNKYWIVFKWNSSNVLFEIGFCCHMQFMVVFTELHYMFC